MRRFYSYYKSLIIIYSSAVAALGSHFLLSDKVIMRSINGGLPLDFMLRFGIFWFLSFVLALLFFLFHLHLNKYYFSDSDILQSSRLGKMAFTVSVGAAIIGGILYTAVD